MIRLIKAAFHYIYTYIACWCIERWVSIKCYYRVNKALRDRFKREICEGETPKKKGEVNHVINSDRHSI